MGLQRVGHDWATDMNWNELMWQEVKWRHEWWKEKKAEVSKVCYTWRTRPQSRWFSSSSVQSLCLLPFGTPHLWYLWNKYLVFLWELTWSLGLAFGYDLKMWSHQFKVWNWCLLETFSLGSLGKVEGNSPKSIAAEVVFWVFILEGFVAFKFCYLDSSLNLKVSVVSNFIPVPEIIN